MCHMLLRNRPHSSIKILFLRRLLLVIAAFSDCRAFSGNEKGFCSMSSRRVLYVSILFLFYFSHKMSGSISSHAGATCELKPKKKEKRIAIKSELASPTSRCRHVCASVDLARLSPPLNSLRPTSQTINKCLLMRKSGGPLSSIISLTVNCSTLILITIRRSLIAPHSVARWCRRCPTRGPSGDLCFLSR